MNKAYRPMMVMTAIAAVLMMIAGPIFAAGQAESGSPGLGSAGNAATVQATPGQGRGPANIAAGAAPGGGQGVGRGAGRGQGYGAPATAGVGVGAGAAQEQPFRAAELAALAAMPVGSLNAREIAAITNVWEEERMARDLYLALGEVYQLPLFNNIARSEQTHIEQVEFLMNRYGLSIPATTAAGALYGRLLERGRISLAEAISVGITLEEQSIQDLEQALKLSDNEDVRYVFTQLLRGSENHLVAFQRQSRR